MLMTYLILNPLAAVTQIVEASTGADLVSNLLTGGGFVFLATVMGGLALWNKNQSESAKTIAEGSAAWASVAVADARTEVSAARAEVREARKEAADLSFKLETLEESFDRERRRFKIWMRIKETACEEHKAWDDEMQILLKRAGVHIRPAPDLTVCSPDDPNWPFA